MFNFSWNLEWERERLLGASMMAFALTVAALLIILGLRSATDL